VFCFSVIVVIVIVIVIVIVVIVVVTIATVLLFYVSAIPFIIVTNTAIKTNAISIIIAMISK
jgi:hypothetical protein